MSSTVLVTFGVKKDSSLSSELYNEVNIHLLSMPPPPPPPRASVLCHVLKKCSTRMSKEEFSKGFYCLKTSNNLQETRSITERLPPPTYVLLLKKIINNSNISKWENLIFDIFCIQVVMQITIKV